MWDRHLDDVNLVRGDGSIVCLDAGALWAVARGFGLQQRPLSLGDALHASLGKCSHFAPFYWSTRRAKWPQFRLLQTKGIIVKYSLCDPREK